MSIASIGVLALSFDAVFIRLAEVPASTSAMWRGAFIAAVLALYLMVSGNAQQFRKLRAFGLVALFVCAVYGFNAALFVFAISLTTVASTVIILCCTPFFAALFSWLLLREQVDRVTWLTIAIAVLGVVIVFLGAQTAANILGNSLALILSASTGFLLTYLRRHQHFPRVPAVACGALLSAVILLPLSSPLSPSLTSFAWLALTGCLLKPLASVCMLLATRYMPSPEVTIFLLLESLLAPIWAWLILRESLSTATVVGGAVVLLVVAVDSVWQVRKDRQHSGRKPG